MSGLWLWFVLAATSLYQKHGRPGECVLSVHGEFTINPYVRKSEISSVNLILIPTVLLAVKSLPIVSCEAENFSIRKVESI